MIQRKMPLVLVPILILCASLLSAQDSGRAQLRQAVATFGQGRYDESLRLFRKIILDSSLDTYHSDGYFWIAKSYMALEQYENASKNLDFFLAEYPEHQFHTEGLYQRGRLLFLQTEYEPAVSDLETFIAQNLSSPFVANSYFWIGESLYALGHFDEARDIFEIVVNRFPRSFKVETARYRVSLIELKERERELLKLLKWSHAEYLRALEEFDRKESSYEQALISYQRKIRNFETGILEDPRIDVLEKQVVSLQNRISEYQRLLASTEADAATRAEQAPTVSVELLELKERVLELKSFYLLWLSALR